MGSQSQGSPAVSPGRMRRGLLPQPSENPPKAKGEKKKKGDKREEETKAIKLLSPLSVATS